MTGAPSNRHCCALVLWIVVEEMPLPPGLLRPDRLPLPAALRERERARAEACRRLAGRGDQAGGPRCFARALGRDVEPQVCVLLCVLLVVKRPCPRDTPGARLVAPPPQSQRLHSPAYCLLVMFKCLASRRLKHWLAPRGAEEQAER